MLRPVLGTGRRRLHDFVHLSKKLAATGPQDTPHESRCLGATAYLMSALVRSDRRSVPIIFD